MPRLKREMRRCKGRRNYRETRNRMLNPEGSNRRKGDDRWKEDEILEDRKRQVRGLPLRLPGEGYGGQVEKKRIRKNHAQSRRQQQLRRRR